MAAAAANPFPLPMAAYFKRIVETEMGTALMPKTAQREVMSKLSMWVGAHWRCQMMEDSVAQNLMVDSVEVPKVKGQGLKLKLMCSAATRKEEAAITNDSKGLTFLGRVLDHHTASAIKHTGEKGLLLPLFHVEEFGPSCLHAVVFKSC